MKNDLTESNKALEDVHTPRVPDRRKFLKGTSLALPAVMTLHIQSVSAQSVGTFFRCTEREGEVTVGVSATNSDGYYREQVTCYTRTIENNAPEFAFVDPHSGFVRTIPNGVILLNVAPIDLNNDPWIPCDGTNETPNQEMFAVVRYDEEGGMKTSLGVVGDNADFVGQGGAGIAASAGGQCWLSVQGLGGMA